MITEVAPGIHQFKVPLPNSWLPYVLVYCLKGDDGYTLIDCGWNTDEAWSALTEQLGELGADVKDVAHLIVTHIHPDHYGLAGRLRDASGCEVVLHEKDSRLIRARYTEPEELIAKLRVWLIRQGVPEDLSNELQRSSMPARQFVQEVEPDRKIEGGEKFKVGQYTLEAMWTPGHSIGHICLVERDHNFVMTGDHVLPGITPNISLNPQQRGNPLADFLDSLDKVRDLGIQCGFAAHEYIIEDLPKRIDELKEHHRERLEEMVTVIARGAATAYEVANAVVWATGSFADFSPWQKRAAITETLAHLEYARTKGMLTVEEKGGIAHYALRLA